MSTTPDGAHDHYRTLYEFAPVGYLTLDSEGLIGEANLTAAALLGVERDELRQRRFAGIVAEQDRERFARLFARAMHDGECPVWPVCELALQRGDGSLVHAQVNGRRCVAGSGTPVAHITLTDLGERHAEEQRTRQALVERDTVLRNALVGIVHVKQRRIVSCNRRFEELFGYGPGELLGRSTEILYDTHETFASIGERGYGLLATAPSFSAEVTLRHKDGSLFWGAMTGCVIDSDHTQEGSIWIFADISGRHVVELEARKLLKAVEQSPVSIVITNREGLIEYVNPGFTRVTGYTREEVIGENPRILQSGETPRQTYEELWQTLLAGKEWSGVVRNRRKNGELFWEEASISPIISDTGEITHFLAVKEDVTERIRTHQELIEHQLHLDEMVKQRTAELEAALEAAKLADHAKDQFLANVSHELRTPLNAVIGLAGLARGLSSDPRQQDYLDKVGNAGKTLSAIINDLLDLSKIAAGRLEFEQSTFSLRGMVARCSSVISFRTAEKHLQLLERIDPQVPDTLLGDSLRIEQILLNLLSNAVKFTEAGRIELRIGVAERGAERVCLCIEVEDTGIGMREEDLALLFKPFSQADPTMTRKYGGTGLGLAICRRLAELMDGGVSVSSRPGQGSTFCVTLWLALGHPDDLPVAELLPGLQLGEEALPVHYQDARVLVVEDQPLNREVVQALLAQVGIVPGIATNGREALDLLEASGRDAFDLVLMDIQMPVLDGLEATRVLRRREGFATLPVIAMTAHTMEHEKEISVAAGMNDHIGKPIDRDVFFRTLAKWLPLASHRRHAAAPSFPASGGISGTTSGHEASALAGFDGLDALDGIDVKTAVGRFAGNTERYRHWLRVFAGEGNAALMQVRQALQAGQTEAARQAAHAFKGRVGMLGMVSLHAVSSTLEAALRGGEPVGELLDGLEHAIAQTGEQIRMALGVAERHPALGAGVSDHAADNCPPAGPLPAAVAQVLDRLEQGDGASAAAIEDCLKVVTEPLWTSRLQQALVLAHDFDFAAARRILGASGEQAIEKKRN